MEMYHSIIGTIEFLTDRAIVHSIVKVIESTSKEQIEIESEKYVENDGLDYLIPMIYKGGIFYGAEIDRTNFPEDYYGHGGFRRSL